MKNNRHIPSGSPEGEQDQALFAALGRQKRRRRRRRWVTGLLILALITAGIVYAVRAGRRKVTESLAGLTQENRPAAYTVGSGSVTTTVSGSGTLSDADAEKLKLPAGVHVEKVTVNAGERVTQGEVLCLVDPSSVLGALAEVQDKINELDDKLNLASYNAAPTYTQIGVNGRVKAIYAAVGDDVAQCMMNHGALAVLSLDGYMAVEIEDDSLQRRDTVSVVRADGKTYQGTVEQNVQGRVTVLVTDDGPRLDETVTVKTPSGDKEGKLFIHDPLRITGYAGKISLVNVKENQQVWVGNSLFLLKDTEYTANYEAILKERNTQEEKLMTLMELHATGALRAPFDGTVSSIEYKDPSESTGTKSEEELERARTAAATAEGDAVQSARETPLLTLSPDREMTLDISVDETNILSLRVGQPAQITVNSMDEVFTGTVTEISRMAVSAENQMYIGVTNYTARITLPKDPRMLPGMSARALVKIQGVADAILIPEKALYQTGDAAFVYTACDEATGELGGAVSVIPGLSDGNMVEIIEGLSYGDTVYYMEISDPYGWYGNMASSGDAWVEEADGYASDGDAAQTESSQG